MISRTGVPRLCLPATILAIVAIVPLNAQTTLSIFDGVTTPAVQTPSPANSVPLSEIEHYSNYNGRLSLTIPLRHIGGRGEAGYDMLAVINTAWDIQKQFNVDGTIGSISPILRTTPSLKLEPLSVDGYESVNLGDLCSPGVPNIIETEVRFQVHWADGSDVNLRDTGHDGAPVHNQYQCQATPPPSYDAGRGPFAQSRDGSELLLQLDSAILDPAVVNGTHYRTVYGILYTANGLQYRIDNAAISWMKDRNGNTTAFNRDPNYPVIDFRSLASVTDSTGNITSYIYGGTPGDCTGCDQIQYAGYNGAPRRVTIRYSNLSAALRSDFTAQSYSQLFPSISYLNGDNTLVDAPRFISSIAYPDGSSYQLRYDPYGEVAEIILPTGGKIDYNYGSGISATAEGVDGNQNDTYPLLLYRRLTERRVYDVDGSFKGSTDYSWGGSGNDFWSKETIKDGLGNILTTTTTHYSNTPEVERSLDPFSYPYYMWGRAIKVEEDAPAKKTTDYTWAQSAHVSWCDGSAICYAGEPENDPRTTDIKTTLNDTQQVSDVTLSYDQFNNITDRKEYDFGQGAPGGLLRETLTYYITDPVHDSAPVRLLRLPSQVNVYDGQSNLTRLTYYHYDEGDLTDCPGISIAGHDPNAGAGDNLRGNLTTKMSWMTANSYVTETYKYDIAGNLVTATDGRGSSTTYDYSNTGGLYDKPTKITNALNQPIYNWYDSSTRQLITSSDLNGVNTVYSYNDLLDRLTQIRRAAGGGPQFESQTNIGYVTSTWTIVDNDKSTTGDRGYETQTVYDGFGRRVEERTSLGSVTHYVTTVYGYDALGRLNYVGNPQYVGGSEPNDMPGYRTMQYDALGRVQSVTASDGNSTITSYSGNTSTVTDPDSRRRKYTYDALGRLTSVVEDPSGTDSNGNQYTGLNYTTSYTYDALGDLTGVTQGGQTRSFAYDGLQRLLSSTQPESGVTSYQYDEDGNLAQKTDARGIVTAYAYDALNRILNKSYNNGAPAVTYTYDSGAVPYSTGRLTQVTNIYGTTNYVAYDPLGRATASQESIAGKTYTFGYGYDLSGALTAETYPSGRVINASFDNGGRVTQVSGGYATAQKAYFSDAQYEPNGEPAWFLYGNGLCRSFSYNSRMQLASSADSVVEGAAPQGTSCFNAGEQPLAITYNWLDSNGKNNGNLWGTTTYQNGPSYPQALSFNAAFLYDSLNRLTWAIDSTNGATNWFRGFAYDQYGNMWTTSNGGTPVSGLMPQTNLYTAANRRGDATYDAAGNQLTMGGTTLTYDAENRAASASNSPAYGGGSETYIYDGDGRRIQKIVTGGNTETYVYDIFGKLIAEYATNPPPSSPCSTCYISTDHLGSTRLVTGDNASIVARHDYVPFGEEIPGGYAGRTSEWGATDNVNQKFTAKERDQETQLDFFGARYYGSALGRFTSPDEPLIDQDPSDPQSWNLYAYVRNSPLRFTDPTGRACIVGPDGSQHDDNSGGQSCADVAEADKHLEPSVTVTASPTPLTVSQFLGFDSQFNQAVAQQMAMDLKSGKYDNLTLIRGEVPIGPPAAEATTLVKSIWSGTGRVSAVKNAFLHWLKHGSEFPNLQNAKQYVEAAEEFVTHPPAGTLSKIRPNGDTVLYNPTTNTFAVKSAAGAPRTMFKPGGNGMEYFNAQ